MPSNMHLPKSGGGGDSGAMHRSSGVHWQRRPIITSRLAQYLLSTAAHATAVYILQLAVREEPALMVPRPPLVQNAAHDSLWPLLNQRVLSFDFNLAATGTPTDEQPPAEPVHGMWTGNGSGDRTPAAQLAVPLLLALVNQLVQAVAFFFARQQPALAIKLPESAGGSKSAYLLILAPMLALSSAATSAALSTVCLGPSLFFVPLMALRALTCLILDMAFANRSGVGRSVAGSFACVGVAGLCAFLSLFSHPGTWITLPVLAALSAVGPWVQDRFQFDSQTRLSQSLTTALMLANLLNVVDGSFTVLSTVPITALVLFTLLSLASAFVSAKSEPTDSSPSSSLFDSAIAHDVFAYLVLGLLGFSDTASSPWTKTAYLVLLGTYAFKSQSGWSGPWDGKSSYDAVIPPAGNHHSPPIRILVGLVSFLTLGTAISDMSSVLPIPTETIPIVVNNNKNGHGRTLSPAHLTHANPNNLDSRYAFAGTILVDPALTDVPYHGRKSARVFALNTTDSASTDADDRVTFQVRVPALDKWPERPWDVIAQNEAWIKKVFGSQQQRALLRQEQQVATTMDHLAMGMAIMDSGDVASSLANVAFAAGTFAAAGNVDCQVFWSGDEDTIAMRGKNSYFVKSVQEMVKGTGIRGPVVMRGDPNQPALSRDVMFFKMLPYMYLTSRPTTRWFMLGTDATMWLPSNVLSFVNTLAIDPLRLPAFFADPSPRTQAMAGGGIIISRALAKLVHQHAEQTCSVAAMNADKIHRGGEMLRECIDRIMRLSKSTTPTSSANATTSTNSTSFSKHHQVRTLARLPVFNSIDMHNTRGIDLLALSGRSYLAARLSRAAPFTLHNLLALPPTQFGMYNRRYAAYKLWHLVSRLPRALQFRRFHIHLDPHQHGTAVVTYGLSVRVYEMKVEQLDHSVDLDNRDMPVDQVGGIEWVLDEKMEGAPTGIKDGSVDVKHDESRWPRRHTDYEEYWLAEVDEREGKMVYVCERLKRKFMLQVKCAIMMGRKSEMPMYDMACAGVA